jgi:hypothetical protein
MSRAWVSKIPPAAQRGGSAAKEHVAAPTSVRNRRRDRAENAPEEELRGVRGIAEVISSSDCTRCAEGMEVYSASTTVQQGKRPGEILVYQYG